MVEDHEIETLCIDEDDPVHEIHEWVRLLLGPELERLGVVLRHFSERSYWIRVWIQPEMAMSVEVRILCGDRLAKMDGLRWLTGLFRTIQGYVNDCESEFQESHVLKTHEAQYELSRPMCQVLAFHLIRHIGPLGG